MEEYFITEIIDISCDENGYIVVKFIIEGDQPDHHRKIESEEYFEWVEEIYGSDELISENGGDEWDEDEYSITSFFNFSKWMEYDHGEETVKDFIRYTYETIDELPIPIIN
tara:strand:- start:2723 stop:3055 length:333 start_codon:yes stop_codon:yes gene_type:complete